MNQRDLEKAALRGEPSYVWRAGQERRLQMILDTAGERVHGRVITSYSIHYTKLYEQTHTALNLHLFILQMSLKYVSLLKLNPALK